MVSPQDAGRILLQKDARVHQGQSVALLAFVQVGGGNQNRHPRLFHALQNVPEFAAGRRRELKHFIGYMPQRFGLYPDLTVEENINFFMDVFGIPRAERKKRREKYLGFSNLLPFVDRLAGNLSGGMKQKLGLACVLVHEPGLLILDEPTNGVDPVSRREFWDILQNMKEAGMTLLVSTAYLDEGEKCDRLALMHEGVILEQDAPGILRGDHPSLEAAIVARLREADEEIAHDTFAL